jgi:hypothetical protein
MRTGAILLSVSLAVAAVLLLVWVAYPTSIPATSYTANRLNPDAYVALKQDMLAYESEHRATGIEIRGDARAVGSIALYCKGVPLIVAANDPEAMTLQVLGDARVRPPKLAALINELALRLKGAGGMEALGEQQHDVSRIDRFVLKHRDRVDLDSSCEE